MNTYIEKMKELSLDNKYSRKYFELLGCALARPNTREYVNSIYGYSEYHHILPKSFEMGGLRDPDNLIYLSAREHFIAHWLLTKMFIKGDVLYGKMVHALDKMSRGSRTNRRYSTKITSRVFERNKKRLAEVRGRPCVIEGVEYCSVADAARELGMKYVTVKDRLKNTRFTEWYFKDSPNQEVIPGRNAIVVDGVLYSSMPDAARQLGVTRRELHLRYISRFDLGVHKPGRPKEDPGERKTSAREVSIDGVIYSSLKDASNETKITNLVNKIRSTEYPDYFYTDGLTEKKTPTRKRNYKTLVTIDGVEYESVTQAAQVLGIKRCELDTRFADINYPTYINPKIQKKEFEKRGVAPKKVVIGGVLYESTVAASKTLQMRACTIRDRIKSKYWPDWCYEGETKADVGITGYQAISKNNSKPVIVNGVRYKSVKLAAKTLKLQEVDVSRRCRSEEYPCYEYLEE